MTEQEPDSGQKLRDMEMRTSSFTAPEPIHERLDVLTRKAREGGITNPSRGNVIAALVASCDLSEDQLVQAILAYKKADEDDLPINLPQSTES